MNYFSLNNKNHKVNFKEALFNGLAPDRGLYFPQEIKSLKKSFVSNLDDYDKIEIVNSINPYRIEGQKSAAFEILDDIGEIDSLCIPVGNAGNITAYWKGFKEYNAKFGFKLPKMISFFIIS